MRGPCRNAVYAFALQSLSAEELEQLKKEVIDEAIAKLGLVRLLSCSDTMSCRPEPTDGND